jgi:HTH-type transcriptional regulator/antitoxin HigA
MAGREAEPAEMLRRALQARGWSERDLAWALGYRTILIEDLLDETRITAEMALRLEASFGISAETWLNSQHDDDLWYLRERMGGELVMIQRRATRADSSRR